MQIFWAIFSTIMSYSFYIFRFRDHSLRELVIFRSLEIATMLSWTVLVHRNRIYDVIFVRTLHFMRVRLYSYKTMIL